MIHLLLLFLFPFNNKSGIFMRLHLVFFFLTSIDFRPFQDFFSKLDI